MEQQRIQVTEEEMQFFKYPCRRKLREQLKKLSNGKDEETAVDAILFNLISICLGQLMFSFNFFQRCRKIDPAIWCNIGIFEW